MREDRVFVFFLLFLLSLCELQRGRWPNEPYNGLLMQARPVGNTPVCPMASRLGTAGAEIRVCGVNNSNVHREKNESVCSPCSKWKSM